jgi:hypothetical protein
MCSYKKDKIWAYVPQMPKKPIFTTILLIIWKVSIFGWKFLSIVQYLGDLHIMLKNQKDVFLQKG